MQLLSLSSDMLAHVPLPAGMMLGLCLGVIAWQHVVGHTSTSAYTMHTPPIILLASISACTAIMSYFSTMGAISLLRYVGACGTATQAGQGSAVHNQAGCSVEYEYSFGKDGDASDAQAEVLNLSMVWSGVYGLGMATFFLSYIVTMASTLATFSFLVGLYAVSLHESVAKRLYHLEHSADKSSKDGVRSGINCMVMVTGIICMSFMGVHIARLDMNVSGQIATVDVFMGVIFPMLTPLLLKAVGSKAGCSRVPVLATWEVSLPFTMAMCILFVVSTIGAGSVPYQVRSHIARYCLFLLILTEKGRCF